MRLTAREDIELSVPDVFAAVADFDAIAHLAQRQGFHVRRLDRLPVPSIGMRWAISGRYRGKVRHVFAELRAFVPGESLAVRMTGGGFQADIDVDMRALSRIRTRLRMDVDLKPQSLFARITVQVLRLKHASLARRYNAGLRDFAQKLELRHRVGRA